MSKYFLRIRFAAVMRSVCTTGVSPFIATESVLENLGGASIQYDISLSDLGMLPSVLRMKIISLSSDGNIGQV